MLSEGAGDDTNVDIAMVLKHPDNRQTIRDAYKNVIEYFQGNDPHVVPQFRTWFYIYKNNTVEEAYKKLLEHNYYVTVKEIDRDYAYDLNEGETTSASETKDTPSATSDVKTDSADNTDDTPQVTKTLGDGGKNNSKDVIDFDTLKAESDPIDETRIDAQKDASKFDEVVEDRQYVEVPEIKKEIEQEKSDDKKENDLIAEKQTPSTETIAATPMIKIVDEPEKFTLPLKQFDEMEIMQAQESRLSRAFAGNNDADGTSIISGNSIVAEKKDAAEGDADKFESKMMLFNGLYYRGNWATPFQVNFWLCLIRVNRLFPHFITFSSINFDQHLRDENIENMFYTSEENKIPVKMMRSRGYYSVGEMPKMDCEAIEFPYDVRFDLSVWKSTR